MVFRVPTVQTVYLFATPSPGYSFVSWSDDSNSTLNPLAIIASSDLTPPQTSVCSTTTHFANYGAPYAYGSEVTLSALPGTNSSFLGWDSYDSVTTSWISANGSLDPSLQKAFRSSRYFFAAYFSPNLLLADANLTDTFKANLSSYPYPLYFSGVPIEKNPSQLTQAHLESITNLYGQGKKVSKLEGIQYAKNLTSLSLTRNALTDLTPLSSLSNLSYLDLSSGGTLSSLNGISSLSNLTYLYLDKHRISSISPLVDLPYLYHLKIKGNFLDLSNLNLQTEIYNLRSRGVTVEIERNTQASPRPSVRPDPTGATPE